MSASDFSDVRVEAYSPDENVVRYTYAGSGDVSLWRATDGVTYTKVITIPSDYGSYPDLYDNAASSAVYYYYKLSDDAGSTFSSVVNVQTMTEFQQEAERSPQLVLPAITEVTPEAVDRLREELERHFNTEAQRSQLTCQVCPTNGALILDCKDGCYYFNIRREDVADVNSISINCDKLEIDFDIPPGTPVEVCGFPANTGFQGDECFQAPLTGPTNLPLVFTPPPSDCEESRIRYPAQPCQGEYTKDCYEKGSLLWGASKFNWTHPSCGGGATSGCCSGNNSFESAADGSLTVFSGDEARKNLNEAHPLSGYSILFGRSGNTTVTLPWQQEIFMGTSGAIKGKPTFGLCVNVPVTATYKNFTGLVFLLDYSTNNVIVGTYAGANLHLGTAPTVIASASIPAGTSYMYIANFPNSGFGLYELYDSSAGGSPLFSYSDSGHAGASDPMLGAGFVWVGVQGYGLHVGRMFWDSHSFMAFWRA